MGIPPTLPLLLLLFLPLLLCSPEAKACPLPTSKVSPNEEEVVLCCQKSFHIQIFIAFYDWSYKMVLLGRWALAFINMAMKINEKNNVKKYTSNGVHAWIVERLSTPLSSQIWQRRWWQNGGLLLGRAWPGKGGGWVPLLHPLLKLHQHLSGQILNVHQVGRRKTKNFFPLKIKSIHHNFALIKYS